MKSATIVFLLAGLLSAAAWGSNIYTVSYEGNAMPESEPGWYRVHGGGDPWGPNGAIRTIETDPDDPNNHFLVINSLASQMIYDYAWYPRQMDPSGQFERWYGEWRTLIPQSYGWPEQGVAFAADSGHIVGFQYSYDLIYSDTDGGWSMPIVPGVFHTYRIESSDMVSYRLWIDGSPVRDSLFFEGLLESYAAFGDGVQGGGARSVVKWDYVRFGVYQVPEPASLGPLLGLCVLRGRRRS